MISKKIFFYFFIILTHYHMQCAEMLDDVKRITQAAKETADRLIQEYESLASSLELELESTNRIIQERKNELEQLISQKNRDIEILIQKSRELKKNRDEIIVKRDNLTRTADTILHEFTFVEERSPKSQSAHEEIASENSRTYRKPSVIPMEAWELLPHSWKAFFGQADV